MPHTERTPDFDRGFVVFLGLVLALLFQGTRGLWEPGEGWLAVAVEGRLRGETLTAPSTPAQWAEVELATLGRRLFGRHEFALRLGNALAGLGVALVVARLGGARGALVWLLGPPVLLVQSAAGWSAPALGWPATPWPAVAGYGVVAWFGVALLVGRRRRGGRLGWPTRVAALSLTLLGLGARLTLATLPSDRDARLLHLSLPDERTALVVSLDDRAHPGLEWYRRNPLVRAEWDTFIGGQASGRVGLAEVLEGTMARGAPPVLFLLPAADVPRLTRELQAVRLTVADRRAVGRLGAVLAFRVVPPDKPD